MPSHGHGMGIMVVASFTAVLLAVLRAHFSVPEAKPASAPAQEFSESRAIEITAKIVSCGVRMVGSSANEGCAAGAVAAELRELVHLAAERGRVLELSPQRASGAFFVDFLGGMMNTYENLTNLVARLPGSTGLANRTNRHLDWCSPPHALLVSSHFDSAAGSHAASDATQNIAMMLEMVRNLLHREQLPVDLIWNFNGGEETFMQAAHGFITSHPWARHVCAVVNLEALGVGGRELLFQAGPLHGWIVEAYADAAVRPHGSSLVQAVFQSGVIPGETDYRIYRDFGGVPGADFAVTGNGWAYHTIHDSMPTLLAARGTLQRYGDNILAFVCELGRQLPQIGPEDARSVINYFDILGIVMVRYDLASGRPLHILAILTLVAFVVTWQGVHRSAGRRATFVLLALLSQVLLSTAVGAAVGGFLFLSGVGMAWYRQPILLLPTLAAPVLAVTLECSRRIARTFQEAEVQAASLMIPGLLLVSAVALPSPTVNAVAYLPLVWLLSPLLLAWPVTKLARSASPVAWTLGFLLPWMCTLQLMVLALEVLVPITGRSGDFVPAAVILGALIGCLVSALTAVSSPLLFFVAPSQCLLVERAMLALAVLSAASLVAVPGAFRPYDSAHPKRLFLQHFSQTFHEASVPVLAPGSSAVRLELSDPVHNRSWIMALPTDSQCLTPVSGFDFFGAASRRIDRMVIKDWPSVYAQLPYLIPVQRMVSPACGGLLEAPPPALPLGHAPLVVALSAQPLPHGRVRLSVTLAAGAPQMTAAVPARGLRGWSFGELPQPRADCNCHFVLHAVGGEPQPPARTWHFWLDLERSAAATDPYALEVYGHWVDGPTTELERLLAELPDFVAPAAFSTMWTSVRLAW